ncbi:hypothetical protein [Massilia glaciei]|uniref:Uncharacterized protein n=1 Tax=Massilia glaciei TaxID=1524097 RepID=A0A2U2HDU0_9BURK|nr:hypothetical protein [Massilia glaciei]PWF41322.1 hypothetical protein C7C56_024850 [Massilia glaciei]
MSDAPPADTALQTTYHVRLRGPRAGVDAAALSVRLAAMFKSTPEQMLNLLKGQGTIVKRGVDKRTAQRYMVALVKAGAACSFEAEAPAVPAAPAPAPASAKVVLDKASTGGVLDKAVAARLKGLLDEAAPAAAPRLSEEALQRLLKTYHIAPAAPADAVPDAGEDADAEVEYDRTDLQLARMALGQKLVIDAVLLNALVAGFHKTLPPSLLLLCAAAVSLLCIVALLRMAAGLYLSPLAKTLAALAMAVPLLNVIVLLVVNWMANRSFREEGYTAGWFGLPADERETLAGVAPGGVFAERKLSMATLVVVLACLGFAPKAGAPVPLGPPSTDPLHPCKFIGMWTSTHGQSVYEFKLEKDGSYMATPISPVVPTMTILYGRWEERGGQLRWYAAGNAFETASGIDDYTFDGKTSFTIVEDDGVSSHFNRTSALPGSCLD